MTKSLKPEYLHGSTFPVSWEDILTSRVGFYKFIKGSLRDRFHHYLLTFMEEKEFVGVGGFSITNEVKLIVSSSAVKLVLFLGLDCYSHLKCIEVSNASLGGKTVGFMDFDGRIRLNWRETKISSYDYNDGYNLVIHEFAHLLDLNHGYFDGLPSQGFGPDEKNLRATLYEYYDQYVCSDSEQKLKKRTTERNEYKILLEILTSYGLKSEAEFFAMATEMFFELPWKFRELLPLLYKKFSLYYRWDPAEFFVKETKDICAISSPFYNAPEVYDYLYRYAGI